MCFLALLNLSLVKKVSLKIKEFCCCCSSKDDSKEKLKVLFQLEEEIDEEMHKIHDSVHKFKNELYQYRKNAGLLGTYPKGHRRDHTV